MKHASMAGFFFDICLVRMSVIERIGVRMKKKLFLLSVDNQTVYTILENFLEK